MAVEIDQGQAEKPGLFAFAALLRLFGVQADANLIIQQCGTASIGVAEMLRCANAFGLHAQSRNANWKDLFALRPPVIAALRDGGFVVVLEVREDKVLVVDRGGSKPGEINHAEFESSWDGRLVQIARREKTAPGSGGQNAAEDSALGALVMLLRFHGIGAEPTQIRHRIGAAKIDIPEMLRCAQQLGLKARARHTKWERLARTPLPGIASLRDGSFLILGKVADDKALLQRPSATRPETMSRAEFEALWDGRIVLMTRRASLLDLSRPFDITWFLGAIHKYRRLLGEVLVASFFLQIFALVSPLFFQVVIDKVLVHRSMSTLDVLVLGLVAISVFETILGVLRTYLFAHTTNRIDVELGARLFRHLVALPIAYFQSRRVGDSVARVRELENIRQFLTSSALTLVIDLFFTFVFVAVMFYYSPLLTFVVLGAFPFYIAISAGATPLFRQRLDEKFRRGAENQAFLVESVTGVETLKAMAVEPQMQRRWEEQLAGYVAASFRVVSLGNYASQIVQFINKLVTAGILFLGAKLVINGSLTIGE